MKHLFALVCCLAVSAAPCLGGQRPELVERRDKVSYSIGYQVGGDLALQNVEVRSEMLLKGIQDALDGNEPLLSQERMRATLVGLQEQLAEEQRRKAEAYRGEGREFLAANAEKEGMVVLPSGLQYRVLEPGNGTRPAVGDTVTVAYRGTLIDGTEFDSSERDGQPATFRLDQVIPGWKEALPLMREGGRWRLFVPPDLAFGEEGPLADRTLIYDLELITVRPAGEF